MHHQQTYSTRILFTQSGELLQDNSYYTFGMLMSGLNYTSGTSPENKYLYNGKELQDDFEKHDDD